MTFNLLLACLAVASGLALHAADEADIARFREARFGLFIHWVLYAQPGGRRTAVANKDMDWGNGWDWPDGTGKDFDRYMKAKVYPQLGELLTNYGEIFVIWFECPNGMTPKQSRDLKDYVRSLQPHVLVSGRIGNGLGDFDMPGDNQLPVGKGSFPLECPMALNDTWGFKWDDHNWKSGHRVACGLRNRVKACTVPYVQEVALLKLALRPPEDAMPRVG